MFDRECADAEVTDWEEAHETLLQLSRDRNDLEGREGRALLRALRSGVHVHLGYGSFGEYVERLFGYRPRTTFDKLRTAEALDVLPELDQALTKGELTWSAVRELARVATAETEQDWLAASKGKTVRDIERLVAGHERGDRPDDAKKAHAVRHVLRFEVAAETLATFRHALQELRRQSGEHLDDDTALLLIARHVLGSTNCGERQAVTNDCRDRDTGRASYQLALTVCERCQRGFQDASGERLEVDPAIIEMARCDAQRIGRIGSAVVESELPTPARCDAQHIGHVGSTVMQSESPTLSAAAPGHGTLPHVGQPDSGATRRATQTIPPALRRHIICRDQGRCVVPGCRHTTFVDLHHIELRAEGGRHAADNLIVLCSAHHRAVHHGQLVITRGASTGLRFAHADGTAYGQAPSPRTVALLEQVFRGLRGLGFREREARRALDAAAKELSAREAAPSAQDLLRAALGRLGPRAPR
jgi:hypothetical protein